jgi:hypothetical protein
MKIATRAALLLLALLMSISFVACADVEETGVWENATYTSDKTFGKGEKTVVVKITAEDQTLTFTLKTDKATLGEALREHELIVDDNGLIHTINGIKADYNNGGWWWKFTKNGEMMMVGADGATIADGEQYEFTRTNTF